MRILITGATGYIGSAVAAALARSGHKIAALVRSADKLAGKGYEPIVGDLRRHDSFVGAVRSSDAVVHMAFDYSPDGGAADQAAIEAMLRVAHGPFIYTSGVWVLGNTGGKSADERATPNPVPVVAWRPAVEKLVRKFEMGMVIRPGCVYGGKGGMFANFWKQAEAGAVSIVGDGTNRWAKIHRDDLADLYVKLIDKRPLGMYYHATDGDESTMRQAAEAMLKAAGKEGTVATVPADQARSTLGPLVDGLVLDQRVSSEKAKRELLWSPKKSFLRDVSSLYAEWRS